MPFARPFAGVDRRVACLRLVLLCACLFGLLASWPLWLNTRTFPLLPVAPWFPILPRPFDGVLLGALLLSLVLALWFYRPAVLFFLTATLFAFCEDQNRGQPWMYLYWVMLWFTLLPAPTALAANRLAISVVYLWSGIQKCNPKFFQIEPDFFIAPLQDSHWPAAATSVLRMAIATAPFVEIGIGLGVWFKRLRPAAIVATVLVHFTALLLLGPLGHKYNAVIWPWNLAMIGLVCVLFGNEKWFAGPVPQGVPQKSPQGESSRAKSKRPSPADENLLAQSFAQLRRSKPALLGIALFSLLPFFSYYGKWDSYFSFSLYADNTATANIFVSSEFADNLPPRLKAQVKAFQPFDPQFQGPYMFNYNAVCYEELHVPPIPELRAFRSVFNWLGQYAKQPGDLRMIVGQRAGPVIFYEGDRVVYLQAK